ncbi:MAG: sensor histidine kinase [Candidatus Nanopelagicales bacterium]
MRGVDAARFPLTALAVRIRIGVAIFTGVVAFAPSLASFAVLGVGMTWIQVATWVAPFSLWIIAWTRISTRPLLLPLAIGVFMTLIVVAPVPEGFTWPRLAGIALALAVTAAAVSGIPATLLWSAYAVALLTLDYLRTLPHAGHLSSSPLDAASTILGLLVIPPAIAVVSRQWGLACREGDAASEASRVREAQARAAERAEYSRAAVDRRIHETVLNTLATIARARTSSAGARAQCAEDLRALDSLEGHAPRDVRGLLALALRRHPVPQPTATVVADDVAFRDDEMASIALVAVGEVLRNIVRHARATRTSILVRTPSQRITFIVSDDGIGMGETARQRFGMRRALRESVESAGGSVEVVSHPSSGTTVTISLPTALSRSAQPQRQASSIDLLLRPPSVRVAMASALVMGLALLVPTALAFSQPVLIAVTYLLFALAVALLAMRWESPRVTALAWACLLAMVASQWAAGTSAQGCTSAGGLHQVLFTTTAAMLLPPLALRHLAGTLTIVALAVMSTLLVPWVLPGDCRTEALVPALETSLWTIALVTIISALSRAFDRASLALARRWDEIAEADARVLAMHAADQRWRSVDAPTRDLIAAVADGSASPDDPQIRAAALRLEARLRSLLETSKIRGPGLRACLEEVVDETTRTGVPVTVVVVSDEADGPIEPGLHQALVAVGQHSAKSGLHLTVLDGEILVAADRSALEGRHLGILEETDDPATAVAVVSWQYSTAPA